MKRAWTKREFLAATIGGGVGLGIGGTLSFGLTHPTETDVRRTTQGPGSPGMIGDDVARRGVRTTLLFKAPSSDYPHPNGLEIDPEGRGIWVAQQKLSGQTALSYELSEPDDLSEAAWLMDWNGNLVHTVMTQSRNTSGMAVGGGYVWMVANADPYGVFQTDMNSRTVSHRQVPLGGGGNHGAKYRDGKLWVNSTRMRGIVRIDPESWEPEFLLPTFRWERTHDFAFDDDGALWLVTGTQYGDRPEDHRAGLAKYDLESGRVLEYAEFPGHVPDPHGLAFWEGVFYSCDAGIHPGWPGNYSDASGYIFRVDLV